jgi:UDP-GlcNAc:undecaprenyl-phosphate GlcNAc-1-phosphate transferase
MKDDALLGFLVALVVAAILTPHVARLARRVGAVDAVRERGLSREATPLLGGLAIFAAALVAALLFVPMTQATKGILGGAALITAVGALDDWRELGPGLKLSGQVTAALVLVLSGVSVESITLPFIHRVDFGTTGDVLTLLGSTGSRPASARSPPSRSP